MKKIIAIAVVALLMFSMASSAFGLVVADPATGKFPPVYINNLVVGDTYLNPFTVKNWSGTNVTTAYAANSNIWFIAEIVVSGAGDTDAAQYWNDAADSAKLVFTGKNNCLNFTAASQATMAVINGLNVSTMSISNHQSVVYATANKAEFYLNSTMPTGRDAGGVVTFENTGAAANNGRNLATLTLDGIYAKNQNATVNGIALGANLATTSKAFYLHFMAMTNEATEGECIGTLTMAGQSDFEWNGVTSALSARTASHTNTAILPGERSVDWPLFNTVNGQEYRIMKINNRANAAATSPAVYGPYAEEGWMYVLMNKDMTKNIISFVVSDTKFLGLAKYTKDTTAAGGAFDPLITGINPNNYDAVGSLDLSGSNVVINYASTRSSGEAITKADLQAIFDFFTFAYSNPAKPEDKHFLSRSGFTSVATAKYNVANAVIPIPDTDIVIPKTGDAATSTGIILAASAILAAAAVGFVLSKRVHN